MPDEIGEHIELTDVSRVDRIRLEQGRVEHVGRIGHVLQPILHDAQYLVRAFERGPGRRSVGAQVRERHHAQGGRRHDVLRRIKELLLQLVRGQIVAGYVVEDLCPGLGPAKLDAHGRPSAE